MPNMSPGWLIEWWVAFWHGWLRADPKPAPTLEMRGDYLAAIIKQDVTEIAAGKVPGSSDAA